METRKKQFLHVDMDAFFAAVEQRDHPELRGKPVVIGAPADERGVVSTCSYEAREFGIRSALPSRTAYQRCPEAIFLPPDMERYSAISKQIIALFQEYTPLVKKVSIDEAFLDVSDVARLFGKGEEIARKLKSAILKETGLTCSIGVARNMFLAKLASDIQKPDGLTVVPENQKEIEEFLAPLDVKRIWGVGKVTAEKFKRRGIKTIADLQEIERAKLEQIIGIHGAQKFKELAFGKDERRIALETEREKSISREHTFTKDCRDKTKLVKTYLNMIDAVGESLRESGLYTKTIHLKLRDAKFRTLTRQISLPKFICDNFSLRRHGLNLLNQQELSQPMRLIGFGVSGFREESPRLGQQLGLFAENQNSASEQRERLSKTVDEIRRKFGQNSIQRGSNLGGRYR